MPRIKLTKSAIDTLPAPSSDVVYRDAAYPSFGVKVTPKGRNVFIVLRPVPHGRCRIASAQVYHRAIRPRHASSSPRRSAEVFAAKLENSGFIEQRRG